MRHIASFAVIAASLAYGGCTQFDQVVGKLSSPETTQAAQNVGQFVKVAVCGLSAAAATAQGVEGQSYGGATPLVDDKGRQITEIVYASSTAACQLIGGIVTASTTVPAATPVVTK